MTLGEVERVEGGGKRALWTIFRAYDWVHTTLGLVGNTAFLLGSILFFWESTKTAGVWLFVVGAGGMLLGSIGQAVVKHVDDDRPGDDRPHDLDDGGR